jgi:hypothetical protein
MPSNYIQSIADKHKISEKKLEDYWEQAKAIASKDGQKKDDQFFGLVTNIFKGLVEKNEKITLEENATTMSGDIAQPDRMLFGKPVFRVSSDLWYKIGCTNRKKGGWYSSFYSDPKIGSWCKENKGKPFVVEDEDTGWLIDVERDKYKKQEKEVDMESCRRK